MPLLQTVALPRSTRPRSAAAGTCCPRCASGCWPHVPGGEVAPVRLERIRLRTLVTLVASVVAAYLLAGELARDSLASVCCGRPTGAGASWRWPCPR